MIPIDPKKKKRRRCTLNFLLSFFPFPILNVELILISFLISEGASFSFQLLPSLVLKSYISGVKSLRTPK